MRTSLRLPPPVREDAEAFVERHLGHLVDDAVVGSTSFVAGQSAANDALAAFDVRGYADRRNEVHPVARRGASRLSPFIRHGMLQLGEVWRHVGSGPPRDVTKFRDELLWQEYARHWYARHGHRTRVGIRREIDATAGANARWDRTMACLDLALAELDADGWLVNQARMWLASHWTVRAGGRWQDGEDRFFTHLLDGSRAANRLGWQWVSGVGSSKAYGFSRRQVERRAPGVCASCELAHNCPIEGWPDEPAFIPIERAQPAPDSETPDDLTGPTDVRRTGEPEIVWLTAESLGDADPALAANPGRPAIFVFDEPLLASLRLSAKRLVFLTETLAELATRRAVEVHLGDPATILAGRAVAVTHAPVPGFADRSRAIAPVEIHPWPWLARPSGRSVSSFSAWRRSVEPTP